MTAQEENWEIMSVLRIPWKDCLELTESDKKFLMVKVDELKELYHQQQEQEQAMLEEQQAAEAAMHTEQGGGGEAQLRASDGRPINPW